MDWVQLIAELILPALGLVFTVLLAPIIRESRWQTYAKAAVRAAEQIFGKGTGTVKYGFVRGLLVRRFRLSEQEAERLIEAAVYELHRAGNALVLPEGTDGGTHTPTDGGTHTPADGGTDTEVQSEREAKEAEA